MITLDAFFAEEPLFPEILSTSNLVQPDEDAFFSYIKESFDQGPITSNGPAVNALEMRLAALHNVKHCVAFCNGFWTIALTIKALALEGKTEVVMPSFTYRRMADIMAWLQLTPHLCDVDPVSLAISYDSAVNCVNENAAIIMAPHPIVSLCDIEGMQILSEEYQLPLLFDSVEAAYASHQGVVLGGFGNAECYSLHASKFLNGFEGGYMTTNDSALAHQLRQSKAFGLNDIHAAMTLASLDGIEEQVADNKKKYRLYQEGLANIEGLELFAYLEKGKDRRTFKNIVVRLNKHWAFTRDETLQLMQKENLLVRPYYSPSLHEKPTSYERIFSELPVADRVSQAYMILPSGAFVNEADIINIRLLSKL